MVSSKLADPQGARPLLHLTQVEGMRALAALVVFVNHAYAQVWERAQGSAPDGIFAPLSYSLVAGHLSVSVFIVISGFCLALPVVRDGGKIHGGPRGFLARRARRILPPYYAALLLSLILIWTIIGQPTGTLWDVPIQVSYVSIISHLLLLQDLFATGSVNYVFWSIAVEWQIYFLFPLMIWSFQRFGMGKTLLAALLAGFALRYGFADTRLARANPHFIGLFGLGVLAAFVATSNEQRMVRLRDRKLWGPACALFLVAACCLVWFWGVEMSRRQFPVLDLIVGAAACSALVLTTRDRTMPLARILAVKPLVFVGTFSYSLYLIHAPLLQIMWQFALEPAGLGQRAMFLTLMTAGLLTTLLAAYLFFRLFEAPFMRARSRTARAPKPAAVTAG